MHFEHLIIYVFRDVFYRAPRATDAGIVDQNVNRAGRPDSVCERRHVPDIGDDDRRVAPMAPNHLCGFFCTISNDVVNDDVRAAFRHKHSVALPHATAGTGN